MTDFACCSVSVVGKAVNDNGNTVRTVALVYAVFVIVLFSAAYSLLYKSVDIIVYGSYEGKMLLIFSDKSEEIAQKIMTAGKGVTFLSGKGAYSGDEKQVICCAVRKNDYVKVKRYVKEVDESAFMIITSAKEVLGKGFKEIN